MTFIRQSCALVVAWLCFALLPGLATAGTEYSFQLPKQNYNASQARNYRVYVPSGYSGDLPMVMTLHGCQQTEQDVLNDWGMKAAADRFGFVLVTPFITSYTGLRNENCWGFWFEEHRHQGGGEAEDLHQIGLQVEQDFNIDANRRYITGLSSGGAMTVVAAVTHNEYWAAAASASGLAYGEDAASVSFSNCPGSATFHSPGRVADDMSRELNNDYPIPMMVLQNNRDCTVVQPAGQIIRDAHLLAFADSAAQSPQQALTDTRACAPFYQNNHSCEHKTYTQDGQPSARSLVETIFFDGPRATANSSDTDKGHYWIGGEVGNEGRWAVRAGPEYPDIIWDFFNRHPRDGSDPINKPVITLNGDNPLEVALNTSFTDPGASATDAVDGTLAVNSECDVDTSEAGQYYCTYSATNSASETTVTTRTVEVYDPNQPDETCAVATDSPRAHITANRALAGGDYNLRAMSNGDQADIGFAWDSWGSVALTEGEPGQWYSQPPAVCNTTSPQDPPPSEFECQQWYATNLSHDSADRAYYQMGYYTQGGNDSLGGVSGSYAWVSEVSEGYFVSGVCP